MMKKLFDLSVSNYGTARKNLYSVTILPWGATEPHNQHLPYMTNCILSRDIAVEAAEKGVRFAAAVVEKYVTFLTDFARVESIDDLYEPHFPNG